MRKGYYIDSRLLPEKSTSVPVFPPHPSYGKWSNFGLPSRFGRGGGGKSWVDPGLRTTVPPAPSNWRGAEAIYGMPMNYMLGSFGADLAGFGDFGQGAAGIGAALYMGGHVKYNPRGFPWVQKGESFGPMGRFWTGAFVANQFGYGAGVSAGIGIGAAALGGFGGKTLGAVGGIAGLAAGAAALGIGASRITEDDYPLNIAGRMAMGGMAMGAGLGALTMANPAAGRASAAFLGRHPVLAAGGLVASAVGSRFAAENPVGTAMLAAGGAALAGHAFYKQAGSLRGAVTAAGDSFLGAFVNRHPVAAFLGVAIGASALSGIGSLLSSGAQEEYDEYGHIDRLGMDPNFMNSGNMALASYHAFNKGLHR